MTTTPSNPADDSPSWETLARYRAGESSADEARVVAAWLARHPVDARLLESLDESLTLAMSAAARSNPDVDSAYRRVRAQLPSAAPDPRRREPLTLRRSRKSTSTPPARRWVIGGAIAAAAAAVLLLGTRSLGRIAGRDAMTERGAAGRVVATTTGVRDSVRLPDGTRVILAPGSRVAIASGYGRRERRVQLLGAAWFAVHHDDARPFVVEAGRALVRDLGTEFVVRTDGAERPGGVVVLVTQGRVSLADTASKDSGTVLSAGDRGQLVDGQIAVQRGGVSADDVAWTSGRLVYRATPLAEVGADLQRWYGVQLRIADSALAARRLTATFQSEPLDRVLAVLSLALGAEVERHGAEVVLRPAAGAPR